MTRRAIRRRYGRGFSDSLWRSASLALARWRIRVALHRGLTDMSVFDHVVLPSPDGPRALRHVVVGNRGVFVVQSLLKVGRVYGSERQAFWIVRRENTKRRFANPLWDTQHDCSLLARMLDVSVATVFPVVVFLPGAILQSHVPEGVFADERFVEYVRDHDRVRLAVETVSRLAEAVRTSQLTGTWTTRRSRAR